MVTMELAVDAADVRPQAVEIGLTNKNFIFIRT